MAERIVNRRDPGDVDDDEVQRALGHMAARDPERGQEAEHVVEALTWGEGLGRVSQTSLQNWLWYELTTKYLVDEPGFAGRLAGIAAELFDELGLDRYAAVCRSEATARVHAAFEVSREDGFAEFRRARDASGIDPPDTTTFAWGGVMGIEESQARDAVGDALEQAIARGDLSVGARGWRTRQRRLTDAGLDADHPSLPGQSWRTAVRTERIGRWIAEAERRSKVLTGLRSVAANQLLTPGEPPDDVAERFAPLLWFLEAVGESQKLTQAGYLNTTFVHRVVTTCPWDVRSRTRGEPRTEADTVVLFALRHFAVQIGALRKRRGALERTKAGTAMLADASRVWDASVERAGGTGWEGFCFSTAGLVLLCVDDPISPSKVWGEVADAAGEMGWQSDDGDGWVGSPSPMDVNVAIHEAVVVLEVFGMLEVRGDWRNRTWQLTPAGHALVSAMMAAQATGPREQP